MKRFALWLELCLSVLFVFIPFSQSLASSSGSFEVSGRKIVVFKNQVSHETQITTLDRHQVTSLKSITSEEAVVLVNKESEQKLKADTNVLRVEEDPYIEALARAAGPPQVTPGGVSAVHAPESWRTTTGAKIRVAVIDTGIDLTHPDLAANIGGGINLVKPSRSPQDDNGHGTHVAGTIGAIQNSIGVVGVAPSAQLFAVKSLDSRGGGYLSDIVAGIDWSIQNHMQVINMSLGAAIDSETLHAAVSRAHAAGITIVAAAGNDGGSVMFPAAYPEVIAVGAVDANKTVPSFSARGAPLDLVAPGVRIESTYKHNKYRTESGTSMAAAHVSGVVALLASVPTQCDTNQNGVCDPDEIQRQLEATADNLLTPGKDGTSGAGLVNAKQAVSP